METNNKRNDGQRNHIQHLVERAKPETILSVAGLEAARNTIRKACLTTDDGYDGYLSAVAGALISQSEARAGVLSGLSEPMALLSSSDTSKKPRSEAEIRRAADILVDDETETELREKRGDALSGLELEYEIAKKDWIKELTTQKTLQLGSSLTQPGEAVTLPATLGELKGGLNTLLGGLESAFNDSHHPMKKAIEKAGLSATDVMDYIKETFDQAYAKAVSANELALTQGRVAGQDTAMGRG